MKQKQYTWYYTVCTTDIRYWQRTSFCRKRPEKRGRRGGGVGGGLGLGGIILKKKRRTDYLRDETIHINR
jgi:hypothetical protein